MRLRRLVPALLAALPLFAYVLFPLAMLLGESLSLGVAPFRAEKLGWDSTHQPVGAPLRALLNEPLAAEAVWGTLKLALGTVAVSSLWGVGLALLWWRRDFPGRKFFALLGYAPVAMPPLVGTLAFFRLIGDGGVLWNVLPDGALSNFGRVLLMHAYSFGVYTYAFSAAALQDADASREEAGRSLGGGTFSVFRAAVWPVLRGPLSAAALLTFMAAAASFSGPYFLDNTGRYLTVEILRSQDDPGLQRALTVALALISFAALPAFLWAGGLGGAGEGSKGGRRAELVPSKGGESVLRLIASLAAAAILLAPPLLVAVRAFDAQSPGTSAMPLQLLSANDFASLGRSCGFAAIAAIAAVSAGFAIALVLRRARWFVALPLEGTVMLTVALPGSVVAIALLSAYNGPSVLTFGVPLGGSAAILILAYFVRILPLAVRPARAALDALGPDVERAAASLGAGRWRTVLRVVLPGIFPSLAAALLLCFVTGAGEFVASQLLYDTHTRPVSVQIAEHFRTDPDSAFALSFCLMLVSVSAVCVGAWIQQRARK